MHTNSDKLYEKHSSSEKKIIFHNCSKAEGGKVLPSIRSKFGRRAVIEEQCLEALETVLKQSFCFETP